MDFFTVAPVLMPPGSGIGDGPCAIEATGEFSGIPIAVSHSIPSTTLDIPELGPVTIPGQTIRINIPPSDFCDPERLREHLRVAARQTLDNTRASLREALRQTERHLENKTESLEMALEDWMDNATQSPDPDALLARAKEKMPGDWTPQAEGQAKNAGLNTGDMKRDESR